MMTGESMVNTLIDELNEINLTDMASTLDVLYHSDQFQKMDRLTLLSEIIGPEYERKLNTRIDNRLKRAALRGCPQSLDECVDSRDREYYPNGITETLSTMNFIKEGLNVCILGQSGSGKTYLAKAIGIQACNDYTVEYHHCEEFLEELIALNEEETLKKYKRKITSITNLDLLIMDDFLLNTLSDEREVKMLLTILEKRIEKGKSTVVCSQREPKSWASMILNDEVSADAIKKRATRHFTVMINKLDNED